MIARADTPRRRGRFLRAVRGAPCLEVLLPVELALFGRSQPGRFFAGPRLAVDLGGGEGADALAAGGANPEELASFLGFCGCRSVLTDGAAPAGWRRAGTLHAFALAAGEKLALPPADEALWAALTLDQAPRPGELAAFLYPEGGARRDDYYSALCSKRSRGLACVWALRDGGGAVAATIGAYAVRGGQAYLACGCTAEALRGRGVGGRLAAAFANSLTGRGLSPCLLCWPERAALYGRLGFAPKGTLGRYISTGKETETSPYAGTLF